MTKQHNVRQRIAQINGLLENTDLQEAFTKQHYIAIAKVIKNASDSGASGVKATIARGLADIFEQDNNEFRRGQFLTACGLDSE